MTHKSAVADHPLVSNERLEFLGDAILGYIIARYLFEEFPKHNEGALAKGRSLIVCRDALAAAARLLDLRPLLEIGCTEEAMGGRNRASLIADAFEALIAVIAIESGPDSAREFVLDQLEPAIDAVRNTTDWRDAKTTLQEKYQASGMVIEYRIVDEYGKPHDRTFTAEVYSGGKLLGSGIGKTKKEAQKRAAELALELAGRSSDE